MQSQSKQALETVKDAQAPQTQAVELTQPLCLIGENLEQLKQRYQKFKIKNAHKYIDIHPIILEHKYQCKTQYSNFPKFVILIVGKRIQIKYIYSTFLSMIRKKWNVPNNEYLYVMEKHSKKLLPNYLEITVEEILKRLKAEQQYIEWSYCLGGQMIQGDIDGLIYIIPLIMIAAVPVLIYMGAQKTVKWTVDKVKSIPGPFKTEAKSKFKNQVPFEERIAQSKRLIETNPFIIPIIVEKHQLSKLPELEPKKIVVQLEYTFQHIRFSLTKKINDSQDSKSQGAFSSIYFYLDGKLPNQNMKLKDLYEKHKDKDGFLYVTYQQQESF